MAAFKQDWKASESLIDNYGADINKALAEAVSRKDWTAVLTAGGRHRPKTSAYGRDPRRNWKTSVDDKRDGTVAKADWLMGGLLERADPTEKPFSGGLVGERAAELC